MSYMPPAETEPTWLPAPMPASPPTQPSHARAFLEDLLSEDLKTASVKTRLAARQIESRVRILAENLDRIDDDQLMLENKLLQLLGMTFGYTSLDKVVRSVETDWLALERDRRQELATCWRDIRDLQFAFINYEAEAKAHQRTASLIESRDGPSEGPITRELLREPIHAYPLHDDPNPSPRDLSPLEARVGRPG